MKKKSMFSISLFLLATFAKPYTGIARSSYLSISDTNSFMPPAPAKTVAYANPEAPSFLQGTFTKYMSTVREAWDTKDLYLTILTGTIAIAMADAMFYSFTRSK